MTNTQNLLFTYRIAAYKGAFSKEVADYIRLLGLALDTFDAEGFLQTAKDLEFAGYDLCILSDCPELSTDNKYVLLERLKSINALIPCLFVTNTATTLEIIKAFELGIDDYVQKPFNIKELAWRIKAIIRRYNVVKRKHELTYALGHFILDVKRNRLLFNDGSTKKEIALSRRSTAILRLLASYGGEYISKDTIMVKVWGESSVFTDNSLRVYMTKLRKHLKLDPRIKLQGCLTEGYRLTVDNEYTKNTR